MEIFGSVGFLFETQNFASVQLLRRGVPRLYNFVACRDCNYCCIVACRDNINECFYNCRDVASNV